MDDLQTDLAAWNLVDNVSICTCKRLQERDELGLVRPEDFVLGFTTSDQLELWADRGDRAICVDTSQVRMSGSPAQQETCVSVTAVLALGERGDACPVAWLLTSCYSEALLKHFFMCLQVAFESFHGRSVPVPRLLVCEATSPAQRLWQEVFKCSLTALQATWSTHKIWLPQLHRITDLEKRLQTWTRLCWISRTSDPRENEEEFVTLLESLASDEETLAFSLHLQQEWLPSLQPRGGRQMLEKRCQDAFSTGLYLDVLHSLLHFLFVEETFSLDYDECVAKLNCYSTAVLRAMKESPPAAVSVPGAPRCRASQLIATRHAEATTLGPDSVTPLRQHEWRVRCHKRPDVWYSVTRLAHKTKLGSLKSMCSAACTQACWQCEVCVHQYTCTCPDSTVLSTVCVHVHLIRILMRDPHHGSSAPAPAPCEPPGHLKDFRSNEKIKLELRSKCAALTALLAKCDPNNGLNGWSRERLLRCDHLLDEALTTLQDTEEAAPLLLQNDSVQVLYSCDANSSDVYTACGAQTDIYSNGDVGAGTEVQSVPLQTDYSNPQVLEDSGTHVLGEELSTVESLLVLHEENGRYSLVGGEAEELLQASVAKPGRGLLYLQRPGSAALTDADSTSADLLGEEPPVAEKTLVLEGVSTCGELLSNC
ncbi:uncharacterized protein LOC108670357 [Hyalella azteca]|uniref:Uncharacterized protein LOC108670357 n=1 Tax=Hyalella azteca TaxID=294128 RepID=A0A8B7NI47_HYAAZ|nr:uncharacterized protein LOC108670357 [Hyalella azteca]